MLLSKLPEGARFRTVGEPPYKSGTVVGQGNMGTRVRFDGVKATRFTVKRQVATVTGWAQVEEEVKFKKQKAAEWVSGSMEVRPL